MLVGGWQAGQAEQAGQAGQEGQAGQAGAGEREGAVMRLVEVVVALAHG